MNEMLRHARRLIISVIGGTVVVLGLLMLVLPGPGLLVIPVGIAILATEFVWAARLLERLKRRAADAKQTALRYARNRRGPSNPNAPRAEEPRAED